ncbi:RHS repeat domain-containing protein [Akkermansia glycaniphila]|uniref:Rhs protein signature n=1 Tax=Akkermansia glycaniphila TaxID=1679444 RepID=A0A1C7PJG2_9BACT|nr:RHS repeat-associated core domain-containing protein [Akkermansia glycaniphila]OCA04242.1 hypothetical protein AC781_00700 [Akkermansia glycaniphila]SEH96921.1 rhs protein signature [Akkermansia glycaniphila]
MNKRRYYKKLTVNGVVTLHQHYLYRGYLQIAALDLTRSNAPALWLLHWDPSQPVATRPLSLRKNGTWYTYGHDLTKNVTELYKADGTIATAYDYTPYGSVTASGIDQPIQWSSEHYDPELALVYYNYRHYNPLDGRWIDRDPIAEIGGYNVYGLMGNAAIRIIDWLGTKKVEGHQSQVLTKDGVSYPHNWSYGFHVEINVNRDKQSGTIDVMMTLDLEGRESETEQLFENAIKKRWDKTHALVCEPCCIFVITFDIVWQRWWRLFRDTDHKISMMTEAEKKAYRKKYGKDVILMTKWRTEPEFVDAVGHEIGHLLGLLDRYYNVNGVEYGRNQKNKGIMHEAQAMTIASEYDTIIQNISDEIPKTCYNCKVVSLQ